MKTARDIQKFLSPTGLARFEQEFAFRGMSASVSAIVRDAIIWYLKQPIKDRYRDPNNQPKRGRRRRMQPMDEGPKDEVSGFKPTVNPDVEPPQDKATS